MGQENAELLVQLRDVAEEDLALFFTQQLDAVANHMAAFVAGDPTDREAFMARWRRILADETSSKQTILYQEEVAGHLLSFRQFGQPAVSYWLGREYWGKGIATAALARFLGQVQVRPLFARAARDNVASIRVLQKCGFTIIGQERGWASARGQEIDEIILQLGDTKESV